MVYEFQLGKVVRSRSQNDVVGRSHGANRHANPTFPSIKGQKKRGYIAEDYKRIGVFREKVAQWIGDKIMYKELLGGAICEFSLFNIKESSEIRCSFKLDIR